VAAATTKKSGPVLADGAWKGAAQLVPLLVPISSLTLDAENARLHPERNLAALERSLREFGQNKPVVVRDGVVFAGNGLVTAAIRVGWANIAAVDLSHLTIPQARAFGLMDNKSGDLSEWDFQRVADIMRELPEDLLGITGFESFEIEPLLKSEFTARDPSLNEGAESARDIARGIVTFRVSLEQAIVINEAISRVRAQESVADMLEGRALELICADYLAGAPVEEAPAQPPFSPEP